MDNAISPVFKALSSCQLDRVLGLMRMTALAGQVRPCDRARGTRSVAGTCVGDKDETSVALLTAERGRERGLLEGSQSRQTFVFCCAGKLVCRWMGALYALLCAVQEEENAPGGVGWSGK